ncbi:MAG: coenzyme F420-0:L-glutamate ligase [Synergistaceae bacterium]|nr:coenzyme F420-0:L-glutamate ligase [Synergistaceae bacterium]
MRYVGAVSIGIRLQVTRRGADIIGTISDSVIKASQSARDSFNCRDRLGHPTFGTRPWRFTDLIGSLCDLTSGQCDKGTPVITYTVLLRQLPR